MNPASISSSAMVMAFALNGDGSASDLVGETADSLQTIDRPLWLHGDLREESCVDWLQSLGVPDTIIESMVRQDSRPRSISQQDGTLLIVRAINRNPGQDPEDMVSLRIWITPKRMITMRQRRIDSVQEIRRDLDAGSGPVDLDTLLLTLLEKITDRVADFVNELDDAIDGFEENLEQLDPSRTRTEIASLRRQSATVRRYLAPQRDALENFHRLVQHNRDNEFNYFIRELSDRMVRYVEDLDLFRERTQLLLEELLNRNAQKQNARMYVLSIVAAIFLPISFLTGLFGMNVGGLPMLENDAGFVYVSAVMGSISIGTIIFFLTRKWL